MKYFITFGGNPVSMIVGLTVSNIICKNNNYYLKHISNVGNLFLKQLKLLQININNYTKQKSIVSKNRNTTINNNVFMGDIRGKGLFLGIESVNDLISKKAARNECGMIVKRLSLNPYNLLLSTDGPFENVILIKQPICFANENV